MSSGRRSSPSALCSAWPIWVGVLGCAALGCARPPPHIPEMPAPADQPAETDEVASLAPEAASGPGAPEQRLAMPASRAHVLALLSRFQSSITSGEPPLEALLSKSASLDVPGSDGRRLTPSRTAVASALSAHFVDAELNYDPRDVSTRPSEGAEVASVPLEGTNGSSARRIVLSLELGYDEGSLRIRGITLSRDPKSERVP